MISFFRHDAIQRQVQLLVAGLTVCVLLIVAAFVWKAFDESKHNRILYDYHLLSTRYAAALNSAYANVRRLDGVSDITPDRIENREAFINAAKVEYKNMVKYSQSLLTLDHQFPNDDTVVAIQRLSRTMADLQDMHNKFADDDFGFAIALANQDITLDIISAQLSRLHQEAFAQKLQAYSERVFSVWSVFAVLLVLMISGMYLLWHHSLRTIRVAQEHERYAIDALRDSSQRLNEAQRIAMLGSWELDLVNDRLVWSDEIFRMFEIDQSKFCASYEAFLDAIHPDDRDTVNQAYTNSLATRQPYEIVHRLKMADGRVKYVRETCESVFDADGKPLRSVGTVQDITELHKIELELKQHREHLEELVQERTAALEAAKNDAERANKAKSEFLARMSHELRTPMNAIIGFSQVLEIEQINAEQLDFVHEIHRAGDHLLELINELLDLSRIETGKLVTVLQPVNMQAAVTDAVQITQMLITARQISLTNQCDAHATVLADPTRLKQILVNLLSNAAKYNRDGGRILIGCQVHGGDVLRLSVTDTGPGIPEEKQALLFTPFERLGAEFGAIEGAGIGLAISKQLAELMGGKLGFDSTPGEGCTFWVDLPLAQANGICETSARPDMKPSVDSRQLKVLYVEDHAVNLRLVEVIFKQHPNLMLLSAINGELGLDLARRYLPDVILLDIHLPDMDGYAVLRELQTDPATRSIPVVALSADAMQMDIDKGLKAGFVEYLTKPLNVDELLTTIVRCLASRTENHA